MICANLWHQKCTQTFSFVDFKIFVGQTVRKICIEFLHQKFVDVFGVNLGDKLLRAFAQTFGI